MSELVADVPFLSAPSTYQNAIVGPCIAGYQAQVLLFGIVIQQYVNYCNTSRDELRQHSKLSKYTAFVVVAINLVYTALCFEDGYTLAASSDRSFETLATGTVESQFLPLLNGLIAAVTQTFLTLRAGAFFLNRKAKWAFYAFQATVIVLALFGSIASCVVGVISFYRPDAPFVIPYNTVVSIWLWAGAVADCSVSAALAYNLRKRIANFNQATDSVLRRLMLIGLRTASFTAILSFLGAVISSIYSGADATKIAIAIAFWVPTSALYGISLFTTLSSTRDAVEKRLGNSNSVATKFPHQSFGGPNGGGGGGAFAIDAAAANRGRSRSSRSRTATSDRSTHQVVPLAISVHREVVRDIDGVEDEDGFDEKLQIGLDDTTRFGRQDGEPQSRETSRGIV